MEMTGNRRLAVTQQQAWDALNDPEVLKACIPGCEKVEATGENQYAVGMAVRVGPVASRFNGRIQLADVNPPTSYTLNFDGQGGAAGFGKGSARVQLAPSAEGGGCELSYTANAQVGGKIAQVGQRLVDGVARSMADDFFQRFDDEMKRRHPEAYAVPAGEGEAPGERPTMQERRPIPLWLWAVVTILIIAVVWLWSR